jgi:hypothetical protein
MVILVFLFLFLFFWCQSFLNQLPHDNELDRRGFLFYARSRIQLSCTILTPCDVGQFVGLKQISFVSIVHPSESIISGGCRVAGFFLVHDTKTGKMYQMNRKCTKWS